MSRKTQFIAALIAIVARMGGSHLTREARQRTATRFAQFMFERGYTNSSGPEDIKARHIQNYVFMRRGDRADKRTVQNELAHLRKILRISGREAVADSMELSNALLGLAGESRIGTKKAMTDEQLESVRRRALRQKRPGMAALVALERRLGLRGSEAIHARSDTLARWERELVDSGRVNVIGGTKGGKPRLVEVLNVEPALRAIQEAREIADRQGSFLVIRANLQPTGGLMEARQIYHSWCHRAEMQPHSARYAFAQEQTQARIAKGYSEREALIATSLDLGHGDGRGRWVKSVYMR